MMERSFSLPSIRAVQPAQEPDRTVVKALTDELMGRVTGVRRAEVRAQVVAALRDLRGLGVVRIDSRNGRSAG
jgi:hypothetical protein